jgi:hypothetical protein
MTTQVRTTSDTAPACRNGDITTTSLCGTSKCVNLCPEL